MCFNAPEILFYRIKVDLSKPNAFLYTAIQHAYECLWFARAREKKNGLVHSEVYNGERERSCLKRSSIQFYLNNSMRKIVAFFDASKV